MYLCRITLFLQEFMDIHNQLGVSDGVGSDETVVKATAAVDIVP